MNISTDKIYLLGLKNGLFSMIAEFNEDDDVSNQIQSNSSLRDHFYHYENIALASIKKDGSSLFRIYVPFEQITDIESKFQSMELHNLVGSRLHNFKRIDSYCDTNFAEVFSNIIAKNQ